MCHISAFKAYSLKEYVYPFYLVLIKMATATAAAPKTYLTRRGYAVLKTAANEELIAQLKEELTMTPVKMPDMIGADATPFPIYRESSKKLYIPKYFGLQRFGAPQYDTLPAGEDTTLTFKGTLREEQRVPAQLYIDAVRSPTVMGGILSLFCGGGKTVLALYLTAYFKKKTLILVHKEFLLNQWKEEIHAFLPEARVGLIKQSKVQVENKDIVLASVQSLAMRDYPAELFDSFGMVIIDECHHMGAEVFSRALPKITTRIQLGLSATLKRNDGMTKVFYHFLGKPVYQQKKRADTGTEVIMWSYYDPHPDYGREQSFMKAGRKILKTPNMISAIAAFEPRNKMILELLCDLLKREPGRQVLILSERITHLHTLERMINAELPERTVGYYIGGMSQEALDKSATRHILLASYQMSSEGMNIPTLNTLILASPISAVEQSIGRVQRQKPSERLYIPLVIDIWDRFSRFQGQGRTRLKHYQSQGYSIRFEGLPLDERLQASLEPLLNDADADTDPSSSNPSSSKSSKASKTPKTPQFAYRDDDAPNP
jgi:superfamily II DNA or RNA helicase